MSLIHDALRAGHARPPSKPGKRTSVLLLGGGGPLGSAVVEQLLAGRGFAHVRVAVTQAFSATVEGLEPVLLGSFDAADQVAAGAAVADLAIVVFDRERHANGRDAAFLRPLPAQLPTIAACLRARGVNHLIVVMPHNAAMLPQALRAGLANLDEHAVAAIGFSHVVFVRSAQAPSSDDVSAGLQRLADLVLAQLRLMTPQNQQPVRAKKVAELVAALARALPASAAGTRVMGSEQVWHAGQLPDAQQFVQAWLAGGDLPALERSRLRL
jgi:hypothetical protein